MIKKTCRGLLSVLACALALACASCGPHMIDQQSVQPFERKMPNMPAGTVPTQGSLAAITRQQSGLAANPLPRAKENIERGRIYYGYYCLMCHASDGSGDAPVGQSYVPKPTDLSSPRVTRMTDGQLYRAMLVGTGHSPVLEQTVFPDQRWPIVMYVRTFKKKAASER